MKWLAQLTTAAIVLSLLWMAALAVESQQIALPISETAVFSVMLSGLFLFSGPVTGACGIILVSVVRESLTVLPPGRMVFAAATVGLLLLHLSRLERWSLIGRGMVMSGLAAGLWRLQLGFFEQTQTPDAPLNAGSLLREGLFTAVIAVGLWIAAAVLLTGLRTVWRETATRPIHFGSQFD